LRRRRANADGVGVRLMNHSTNPAERTGLHRLGGEEEVNDCDDTDMGPHLGILEREYSVREAKIVVDFGFSS
jgi:hypothetical protein